MPRSSSFAVLGFRPHTYWTAVAAVCGQLGSPRVVHRRRIVFAAEEDRFVYHRAAEAGAAQAPALIAEVRERAQATAAREIGELVAVLRDGRLATRLAVTPASSAKDAESLEGILRSHSKIHAAEGDFYRDVVASACRVLDLEVRRVSERDLPTLLGALLPEDGPALAVRLREMGAALGPPWSEDYKLATQAAWLHLDDASAASVLASRKSSFALSKSRLT
jgi:hypothetical protein